ncbi:hypothetical protein [Mesobacillus subterraneus]|uniref:Uncharacterized protein n=1 Tax=Mesobacillus subterraneus TaxID=285983 RepID=A0A3R9F3I0_9BACI|nr:hypothetical protein [Mesobacillus subterraneus]RSD29051.1 hypothetical protein EJA10_02780 [Mesobacillus subterraneus]
MMKRPRGIITVIFIVSFLAILFFVLTDDKHYQNVSMVMIIEEKAHYIEPGKYQKMWVVGSNANDPGPNKERFKVMIEDARIYNLIEEGKEYFVSFQGEKKMEDPEYLYTFGQIEIPGGTQMAGEGVIKD